ncbi:MAG TPA: histidine kinase, partial [Rhodospirillaceae bacterium]|nr:histidine kinase [Rhodospirillaceae bacterium]
MMSFLLALERLRLAGKLAIGFGVMLLGTIGLGLYSLQTQDLLEQDIHSIAEADLRGLSNLKDARIELAKMGRALRQAILAPDIAERDRALAQLAEAESGIHREVEEARLRIFREENRANLAQFEDTYAAYRANIDQAVSMLRMTPGDAVAFVITPSFQQIGAAADATLEAVAESKETGAMERARQASERAVRAQRATVLLLLGGSGFGL